MNNTNSDYRFSYETRMNTGVLLLLNSPSFMKFGIDMSEWTIGAKFMGIKLIPLGIHYISFSLKDENYQMKQGFFISITSKSLNVVRKWSDKAQAFLPLKEEDDTNFKIGISNLDFDKNLGDYPITQHSTWKDLSSYITDLTINNIQPDLIKYISINTEYDNNTNNNNDVIPNELNFTDIPMKVFNNVSSLLSPEQVTKMNIDKTQTLSNIIKTSYNNNINELLGELQIAFVTFIIGEKYESLMHWKNMLMLLTSCEEGIHKYVDLFCKFIEVFYNQLRNVPKDIFYDEIIGNNFLRRVLDNFILGISESEGVNGGFMKRMKLFRKFLKEYFKYEVLSEEERVIEMYRKGNSEYCYGNNDVDDDLPVIVDEEEIKQFNERNKKEIDNNQNVDVIMDD